VRIGLEAAGGKNLEVAGGEPIRLHRLGEEDPRSALNVRFRPL
jgi:hypothetical protein